MSTIAFSKHFLSLTNKSLNLTIFSIIFNILSNFDFSGFKTPTFSEKNPDNI